MSYVFRSSGYIRDRSALHCRCIAVCVSIHVQRCASTSTLSASAYLLGYTSYIVRDFAKRSTRNFDATFCCTNAGLSLGNSINLATLYRECLEKDDTREGGFIWRAESKNQAPWMEGYWFLKIRFSREGVKNIFAFFFENVTCRVERVKVFIFKIIEFVIEFLFFFEEY